MTQASVIALPDFTKPFTMEVDGSGVNIGAILMQDHHPIAFLSQAPRPKHQGLSTYETELMAFTYGSSKMETLSALELLHYQDWPFYSQVLVGSEKFHHVAAQRLDKATWFQY